MTRNRLTAGFIAGALALACSTLMGAPANAGQAVPSAIASQIDQQPAEYTMTAAKQRRLMMMHGAQRRNSYRHPGYGRPGHMAQSNHGYRGGHYRIR